MGKRNICFVILLICIYAFLNFSMVAIAEKVFPGIGGNIDDRYIATGYIGIIIGAIMLPILLKGFSITKLIGSSNSIRCHSPEIRKRCAVCQK